jgi:energy-coupling factor transporter transmembrane protein EcfT
LGNRIFLLELIVVVIVVVFLLFFFNRVFGFVASYIIRTVTWHRYKAYIHIEAIQLSFLAGRILFKNFRYQSSNESIYVLKGHITWRYWLRRTRVRGNKQVKEDANMKLPCRVFWELEGVEWFIYSRTPAYDAIIAAAEGKTTSNQENGGFGKSETGRSSVERTSVGSSKKNDSEPTPKNRKTDESDEPSILLHLLPIQVVCKKGAIILGNTNTPSIVVAQFVQADLSVDAAESRSKFDLYKMVYNCNFTRPTVQIKTNIDYKESLLARARHVVEKAETEVIKYFTW